MVPFLPANAGNQDTRPQHRRSVSLYEPTSCILEAELGYQALNFSSPAQLHSATTSTPIFVYNVDPAKLSQYNGAANPNTLVDAEPAQWIIGLGSGSDTRSTVFYARQEDAWEFFAAGVSPAVRDMLALRSLYAMSAGVSESSFIALRALDQMYLAFRTGAGGDLYVIPVMQDSVHNLLRGKIYPAAPILSQLAAVARAQR